MMDTGEQTLAEIRQCRVQYPLREAYSRGVGYLIPIVPLLDMLCFATLSYSMLCDGSEDKLYGRQKQVHK